MTDKLYVVYHTEEVWIDNDWCDRAYYLTDQYFTNEDQAELCAEYLNLIGRGGYFVEEVANGDDIDYKSLIEEYDRKQKEEELRDAKKNRLQDVDNYALYKSRIDGSNYGENLKKYKAEYADYIENGI